MASAWLCRFGARTRRKGCFWESQATMGSFGLGHVFWPDANHLVVVGDVLSERLAGGDDLFTLFLLLAGSTFLEE